MVAGVFLGGAIALFWVSGWGGAFGLAALCVVAVAVAVKIAVDVAALAGAPCSR